MCWCVLPMVNLSNISIKSVSCRHTNDGCALHCSENAQIRRYPMWRRRANQTSQGLMTGVCVCVCVCCKICFLSCPAWINTRLYIRCAIPRDFLVPLNYDSLYVRFISSMCLCMRLMTNSRMQPTFTAMQARTIFDHLWPWLQAQTILDHVYMLQGTTGLRDENMPGCLLRCCSQVSCALGIPMPSCHGFPWIHDKSSESMYMSVSKVHDL